MPKFATGYSPVGSSLADPQRAALHLFALVNDDTVARSGYGTSFLTPDDVTGPVAQVVDTFPLRLWQPGSGQVGIDRDHCKPTDRSDPRGGTRPASKTEPLCRSRLVRSIDAADGRGCR